MRECLFVLLAALAACSSESPAGGRGADDSGSGSSGGSGSDASSGSSGGGSVVDGSVGASGKGGALVADATLGSPEASSEVQMACSSFVATFCSKVETCSPF